MLMANSPELLKRQIITFSHRHRMLRKLLTEWSGGKQEFRDFNSQSSLCRCAPDEEICPPSSISEITRLEDAPPNELDSSEK